MPDPASYGSYQMRRCGAQAPELIFVPIALGGAAPPGGPPAVVVTPEQLAQEARNLLDLPVPEVGVNPPDYLLVQLPTWWWLENPEPITQRTELGPVWAEVTATPVSSSWTGGDPQPPVQCLGQGVEWRFNLGEEHPGSCRYTYRRASDQWDAQVVAQWEVTWVGAGGTGGELEGLVTEAVVPVTVYERQAVVVDGRG